MAWVWPLVRELLHNLGIAKKIVYLNVLRSSLIAMANDKAPMNNRDGRITNMRHNKRSDNEDAPPEKVEN